MGKLSGLASAAIFVGLVFVLVYLCCRVKRKGVVVQTQRNGLEFSPGVACPQQGQGLGYPQPAGQSYAPQMQSHIYGHNSMTANINSPQNFGYPGAYPNLGNTQPPYPPHGAGMMPMPMNHSVSQSQNVQSSAPYPTASAPSAFDDDLPPPYESVVRQS